MYIHFVNNLHCINVIHEMIINKILIRDYKVYFNWVLNNKFTHYVSFIEVLSNWIKTNFANTKMYVV